MGIMFGIRAVEPAWNSVGSIEAALDGAVVIVKSI